MTEVKKLGITTQYLNEHPAYAAQICEEKFPITKDSTVQGTEIITETPLPVDSSLDNNLDSLTVDNLKRFNDSGSLKVYLDSFKAEIVKKCRPKLLKSTRVDTVYRDNPRQKTIYEEAIKEKNKELFIKDISITKKDFEISNLEKSLARARSQLYVIYGIAGILIAAFAVLGFIKMKTSGLGFFGSIIKLFTKT